MAYDVFISYASEDKIVADAVCATLESHAVRCWIAPRDVLPGMAYGEAIIDAIRGCRIMVLVFSSKSNASPHIPKEIERAVSAGVAVIPFRIENVRPGKSLDYFIGSVHWLDAITQPLEQHLQRLVQNVQTLLSRDVVVIEPRKSSATTPPVSSVAPIPSTAAPGPAHPPWLYAALAILAVLVIVFAVLLFARKPSKTAQVVPAPAVSAPVSSTPPVAGTPPAAPASPPSEISSATSDAAVASKTAAQPDVPRPGPAAESKTDVPETAPAPAKPKTPSTPSSSAEDLFDQGSASYKGRQFSQAANLFQKACDRGERKACNSLGLMYDNGEGVPKDLNRAQGLFKRACDAGGHGGCLNLGLLYFRGEEVPKDLDRAAALFKRACDAGGAAGCNNLGLMYHNGEGMPKDLKRSVDLYKRACGDGGPAGCTNLGSMYWRGEEVPRDLTQAASLFKRGCDGGNAASCNYLGLLYERGQGVAKDSSRAGDLFKKACDAGNEQGCGNLSRLQR